MTIYDFWPIFLFMKKIYILNLSLNVLVGYIFILILKKTQNVQNHIIYIIVHFDWSKRNIFESAFFYTALATYRKPPNLVSTTVPFRRSYRNSFPDDMVLRGRISIHSKYNPKHCWNNVIWTGPWEIVHIRIGIIYYSIILCF